MTVLHKLSWDQTSRRWGRPVGRPAALWRQVSPAQLFVGSFLLLILLGTLGLRVLPGLAVGAPLGWLDALFTATSAVCVTGLIVVDTATRFTAAGQAFILLLIQLGGLGIITFTTLIILLVGGKLPLRQEVLSASGTEVAPHVDFRDLTRNVVRFTLVIEAAGALLLYLLWIPRLGGLGALWPAVFHAVSAFCNAGFSTFSDSLVGFRRSPATLAVVMALIVVGGMGFLTMQELYLKHRARRRHRGVRLSLHSRLALVTTAVLLVGGWVLYTLFEWSVTFHDLPSWGRLLNGLFMSVTARTAGFNTVDYAQTTDSSNFLTILLMSIGGSPGSTAGGIKTTTAAVIVLLAWSRLRGEGGASAWSRTIPEETLHRAVGLFVLAFGLVTLSIFLLTVSEIGLAVHTFPGGSFLHHMFEATSAFNTVGLSMGVTDDLSPTGEVITVLLMFLGRVGPLTFAAAIALRAGTARREFRFAYEDVIIG